MDNHGVYHFSIPGVPVPWSAPTVTRRLSKAGKPIVFRGRTGKAAKALDQWQRTVVAEIMAHACNPTPYTDVGAVSIAMVAVYAPPASWSQKKKLAMAGKPKTTQPDGANILKSTEDALQGIVVRRDCQFWHEECTRRYCRDGEEPHTEITLVYI